MEANKTICLKICKFTLIYLQLLRVYLIPKTTSLDMYLRLAWLATEHNKVKYMYEKIRNYVLWY